MRNLRLAFRSLAKTPGFTATVILTLALGIGANTAVFSALDAVVLRPMPFPESERLVTLAQRNEAALELPIAPVRIEDWNRLNDTFEAISGSYNDNTTETAGELPERIVQSHVAPRFLQVLGVTPAIGRGFSTQEETSGPARVVLLSDHYWKRRFGADPAVLGTQLRITGTNLTIIGVMPASFRFRDPAVDIWWPVPSLTPFAQGRNLTWFDGVGRLKVGVTLEQARANLTQVQAALGQQFPDTDAKIAPGLESLKESAVASSRTSLWLLYGSVSLLLLIACSNIAALLLARASHRQQEISVRFSLGATRASIVAQLLTEAFVLAVTGAALGLAVAATAARVFRTLARDLPRVDEIALDSGTLLYTLVCAVAVTFVCGVLPSIRATRDGLRSSMAAAGRSLVSSRNPVQWTLVGVQIALSVTLLAGAGLMIRSFQELARISPGFDPANVLTFRISSSWAETGDWGSLIQRTRRMVENLRTIPGVEDAAIGAGLPGVPTDPPSEIQMVEARPETELKIVAATRSVAPGFFSTMKIPLLAGELCREEANTLTGMVNRAFADKFYPGANVTGLHVRTTNPATPLLEIRGVVGDAHENGLTRPSVPTLYTCRTFSIPPSNFLVRSNLSLSALSESIRRKIAEIDASKSVFDLAPLEDRLSDTSAQQRLITVLLGFFAATAIGLACLGVYATLSYFVTLRRREIGLRLAVGAGRSQILGQFVKQSLSVTVLGCLAGLALAAATTRMLTSVLFGVSPSDLLTLGSVIALVLGAAIVASLLPSLRAARLEPMQVLRSE